MTTHNQKTALSTVLSPLGTIYKTIAVMDWLEDINFHTERSMIWDSIDTKTQQKINFYERVSMCQKKSFYGADWWDYLVKHDEHLESINEAYVAWSKTRHGALCWDKFYTNQDIQSDVKEAQNIRTIMSSLFGYGIECNLWGSSENMVQELLALINE